MTDHFTTMLYTHLTDEALLVGARNILYKLSVDELRLKQTLTWHSLGKLKKEFFTKWKLSIFPAIYRPGQANVQLSLYDTVWKFPDFSISQNLREINFGDSRSAKSTI